MSIAKQARWIEEVLRGQEISRSIHLAIERYRGYDKNQLKSSIDKPGVERCRGGVEKASKQFFKKGKTQI